MNLPPSGPNLHTIRARKARLARRIGKTGYQVLLLFALIFVVAGAALYFIHYVHIAYPLVSLAIISLMFAVWYDQDLSPLPPEGTLLEERLSGDLLGAMNPAETVTPHYIWSVIGRHWQSMFFAMHFLLPIDLIQASLSTDAADMNIIWKEAERLANANKSETIEVGYVDRDVTAAASGADRR
jgi:hypothetical protein